jgi:quinol monooxygenase YgiN
MSQEPICHIARWRCDPARLAGAEAANREFVAHIRAEEPGTRLYISLQDSSEPTRFLNLMIFVDTEAEEAHRNSEAVKRFTETIYPSAVEDVTFADFRVVASTL